MGGILGHSSPPPIPPPDYNATSPKPVVPSPEDIARQADLIRRRRRGVQNLTIEPGANVDSSGQSTVNTGGGTGSY